VLSVASLSAAHISLGAAFPAGASLLIAAGAADSTLVSAAPVKLLRSANWTGTLTSSTITAPSVGTLLVPGVFDATVTLTGAGNDVNVAEVGQPQASSWHLTGSAKTFVFSGAFDGTLSAGGSVNEILVRTGGLDGTIKAGSINVLNVNGNVSATLATESINTLHDLGNITTSSVNVFGNLRTLSVSGQIGGSTINVGGILGTLVANSVVTSSVDVDISSGVTLANATARSIGGGTIHTLALTGRTGDQFSDSVILARTIGSATFGTVDTSSDAGTEGVAADSIASLSANVNGTAVRQRAATVAGYLASNASLFSEFQVKLVS
jgi:hypothetical protein